MSISHGVAENHLLDAMTGLSFFLCGAITVDRQRGTRLGLLMFLNGVALFCGSWANIAFALTLPLLLLATTATTGLLAHLVMAYPTGRLTTRFERVVLVAAYVVPVGAMVLSLGTVDPARCPTCATLPVGYADAELSHWFYVAYDRSAIVLVPMFLVALWLRWRRSSRAARHDLAPLWTVAAILVIVFAVSPFTSTSADGFAYLEWQINSLLRAAVPVDLRLWTANAAARTERHRESCRRPADGRGAGSTAGLAGPNVVGSRCRGLLPGRS